MAVNVNPQDGSVMSGAPSLPAKGTALLTCMELSSGMLGQLFCSEEAGLFVVTNAGGVATPGALYSMGLAKDQIRRVVVVHHTQCQLLPFTDCAQLLQIEREDQPELDFQTVGGVLETVKSTVSAIRKFPNVADTVDVQGYVFDRGNTLLVCF